MATMAVRRVVICSSLDCRDPFLFGLSRSVVDPDVALIHMATALHTNRPLAARSLERRAIAPVDGDRQSLQGSLVQPLQIV